MVDLSVTVNADKKTVLSDFERALTMKFVRGGRETWAFLQASDNEGYFVMTIVEREAMKQDVAVNALADKLAKDGFVALYINFDTGKATIRPPETSCASRCMS